MKKGDIVTIDDGSWARSVVDGELIHEWLAYGSEKGRQYKIVVVGCGFPLELGCCRQPEVYRNDTVIQAVDSGKVVFIHGRLLSAVKPVREVTMAEVCKQFGEPVKIIK